MYGGHRAPNICVLQFHKRFFAEMTKKILKYQIVWIQILNFQSIFLEIFNLVGLVPTFYMELINLLLFPHFALFVTKQSNRGLLYLASHLVWPAQIGIEL